jgi:hypothetical protein
MRRQLATENAEQAGQGGCARPVHSQDQQARLKALSGNGF